MQSAAGFVAQGNINPCSVVVGSTTVYGVIQATNATTLPFGISQEGTRQPPGVTGSDAYAAHSGESILVYQDGEQCLCKLGGTVTYPSLLMANTDGTVVAATAPGNTTPTYLVGSALESGTVGQFIKMRVRIQVYDV